MGHSMLGPHINAKADQIRWLERARPRVGKVLLQAVDAAWMREARAASPDTFWVGRLYVESQPLESPQENARDFCQRLLLPAAEPFRGLIDALEGYNELGFTRFKSGAPAKGFRSLRAFASPAMRSNLFDIARQEMQRYALFERSRTEILASHGWKSVVGNFSTGTPELELWPDFYPALEAGDYLGLHEYSANTQPPYMQNMETWLCRRYRRVYEALPESLQRPLIITECGIDGGVIGQAMAGWRRYTDEQGYLAELRWYDEGLQQDGERFPIVGATIYCYGHVDTQWDSFEIGGPLAAMLADYIRANPPLPWHAPENGGSPDPLLEVLQTEFGNEFDDIRQQLVHSGEYPRRDLAAIRYQAIDHTGAGTTPQTWSNTIARSHVENNGWPAIGYHFLVYPHKVRYTGSLDTARAAVWGREAEVISIAFVGNFNQQPPDSHAIELCRRLADLLDRYLRRQVPRVGHREIALPGHETDSPGATAYGPDDWLRRIQPSDADEVERLRAHVAELEAQVSSLSQQVQRLQGIIARVREIVA